MSDFNDIYDDPKPVHWRRLRNGNEFIQPNGVGKPNTAGITKHDDKFMVQIVIFRKEGVNEIFDKFDDAWNYLMSYLREDGIDL